jgi:hypothetical protein
METSVDDDEQDTAHRRHAEGEKAMAVLKTLVGAVIGVSMVLAVVVAVGSARAADAPERGAGMQAGLVIEYFYNDFRHVDQVVEFAMFNDSAQGEALPNMDFRGAMAKPPAV